MKRIYAILIIFYTITMVVSNSFASTLDEAISDYKFTINLASSTQAIQTNDLENTELQKYKLYLIRKRSDTAIKYHLRLGFFKTNNDAESVLKLVQREYLDVWIDTIHPEETPILSQWLQQQFPSLLKKSSLLTAQAIPVDDLLKLAHQAMQDKQYPRAIGIYTKIVNEGSYAYQQIALENLGLAREKNNQFAHAKADYQLYLDKYPTGEGTLRVKRRLDRLVAQQLATFKRPQPRQSESKWAHYGNLYQFYYKDMIDIADTGSVTAQSLISTNINYTGKTIGSNSVMEANVAASHIYDTDDNDNNKNRLTSIYFDMARQDKSFDIRLGRQNTKTTSIFNRFDGINLGYQVSTNYKTKFLLGYPVEFNETVTDRADKYFYSLGLELFPNSNGWNTNLYYLEQQSENILDRQELAADTRYLDSHSSFYTLLDYSLQYETTNFFLLTFNRRYQDESTFSMVADYRKIPFLTTTNALLGQVGVSSLSDLLSRLTEDEIEQLSLDRTALYKSASASYTRYIQTDLQITADFTASNMSGTVASDGVEALQDIGNEYSYAIGFIRNNLFLDYDLNIINLRHSQLSTSDALLLNLSSIIRVQQYWRINPRLRIDSRDYDDGRSSMAIRPAVSIKYKLNKYWQFEMELSYEDKDIRIPGSSTINDETKLLYAGYILSF